MESQVLENPRYFKCSRCESIIREEDWIKPAVTEDVEAAVEEGSIQEAPGLICSVCSTHNSILVEAEPIVYLRCGNCGVVSPLDKWIEPVEDLKDVEHCAICPACLSFNTEDDDPESVVTQLTELLPEGSEIHVYVLDTIDPPFNKIQLDELDSIKKQIAALKKIEEKLVPPVKGFLVDNEVSEFTLFGHKMVISYQDRGTMNEDALVEIIKEKFSEEEITSLGMLKQVSNPEAVKAALISGRITLEELSECKNENLVSVFNLNPKPRKTSAKSVAGSFGGNF